MIKQVIFILSGFLLLSMVGATQVCQTYDDFSSETLNLSKWEVRQDIEGQPFTDEYWLDTNLSNYHIQQNIVGDRRTYLFPKTNFTTGDIIEYDFGIISKEGNYMQMVLLTGDQYIRAGIAGYINGVQGFDELGDYHIKIEFQENNFHLERTSPSNITLIDDLALTNANGTYELYIGAGSGHNGLVHIDFDNFTICTEQEEPEPTCSDGIQNQNETGVDCGGPCSECSTPEPNCENILSIKPGKSKGLWKKGCSPGTLKVFSKKIGWAR